MNDDNCCMRISVLYIHGCTITTASYNFDGHKNCKFFKIIDFPELFNFYNNINNRIRLALLSKNQTKKV